MKQIYSTLLLLVLLIFPSLLFATEPESVDRVPAIRGVVYDETDTPLASATVQIEGTTIGTTTNSEGRFILRNLARKVYKINVSFVGYVTQTRTVDLTSRSVAQLSFTLLPDDNLLSTVEVFGERYKQPKKLDAITRMPLRPSEQIQSISVISEKSITEQGALTVTDVARNVPGVTLFGSYGGVRESMSIRGYRGVPILKNGVRIDSDFRTGSALSEMQGVESIQVIKGSAAVTQGIGNDLGSAGGVINVVTKTPKFTNEGEVSLRAGSWGLFRPTFDVQSVLDKNQTIAFRMNGAFERSDNYRPVIHSNRVYINPSLEWRPDDKTSVTIEMDYLNDNRTPYTSSVNLSKDTEENLYDMPHNKFLGFKNDNVNNKTLTYAARITRQLTDNISVRAAYFGSSYKVDNTSTSVKTVVNKEYNMRRRTISRSLRDDRNSTFQLDFIGRDIFTGPVQHTFQLGFDYKNTDLSITNYTPVNIGLLSILISIILILLKVGTEKEALGSVPWNTILLISGMGILMNLIVKLDGIKLLADILSLLMNEKTVAAILALSSGILSLFSSTSGVVMPTMIPTIPRIIETLGIAGVVPSALLLSAVINGSSPSGMSPLSTGGAFVMATLSENYELTNEEFSSKFKRLFYITMLNMFIVAIFILIGGFSFTKYM